MELRIRIAPINDVFALWRATITFFALVMIRRKAKADVIASQRFVMMHQMHLALTFEHNNAGHTRTIIALELAATGRQQQSRRCRKKECPSFH